MADLTHAHKKLRTRCTRQLPFCSIIILWYRINHYDFVALHSMWIIFLKGYCVLVRVEILHKSKFLPGTVEKNSSTIRSSGRNRTHVRLCDAGALL